MHESQVGSGAEGDFEVALSQIMVFIAVFTGLTRGVWSSALSVPFCDVEPIPAVLPVSSVWPSFI